MTVIIRNLDELIALQKIPRARSGEAKARSYDVDVSRGENSPNGLKSELKEAAYIRLARASYYQDLTHLNRFIAEELYASNNIRIRQAVSWQNRIYKDTKGDIFLECKDEDYQLLPPENYDPSAHPKFEELMTLNQYLEDQDELPAERKLVERQRKELEAERDRLDKEVNSGEAIFKASLKSVYKYNKSSKKFELIEFSTDDKTAELLRKRLESLLKREPTWWDRNKATVGKVLLGAVIGAVLIGGTILTMGALGVATPGILAISMGAPLSANAVGTAAFASAAGSTAFATATAAGGVVGGAALAAAPDFFTRHKKKILLGAFLSLAVVGTVAASIFGVGVGGVAAASFFASIGSAFGLTGGTAVAAGMGIAVATPLIGAPLVVRAGEKIVEVASGNKPTTAPAQATPKQPRPTTPTGTTTARLRSGPLQSLNQNKPEVIVHSSMPARRPTKTPAKSAVDNKKTPGGPKLD